MIFVLIEADEGDTDAIIVAQSRTSLLAMVAEMYNKEIADYTDKQHPFTQSNTFFTGQERDALFGMLDQHKEWMPGRYILKSIEPHWQQWTLFVCVDSGYSQ